MNQRSATLLFASLLGVAPAAGAQSPPPGFHFPAPEGWARSEQGQIVAFTPPGEPPGSVVLLVMPPIPRKPDFAAQFEELRGGIASLSGLTGMRNAEERRAGSGAKEERTHFAIYSGAGGELHLSIRARAEGTWVGTVALLAATGEGYARNERPAAKAFAAMRLPGGGPVAATAAAGSSKHAGFRGPGISGVWMGSVMFWALAGIGRNTMEMRWKTFFDDGVVFNDLPDGGLLGFDRAASQAHPDRAAYWGRYSFSGSSGAITRPDTPNRWVLKLEAPSRMKIDDDTFYRCASVDGLRLSGAWTSYGNPDDPELDRLPIGQRPIIRFDRSGRFVDEGLFSAFMRSYSGGDDRPGAGTYELRDYTLVLRYDDGRVRREGFTGLLGADPAQKDGTIYLRRTLLRKRSGR